MGNEDDGKYSAVIKRILHDEGRGYRPGALDRNERPRRKRTRHNYFGDPPGKTTDQDGNELEIRYSKDGLRMRCTAWLRPRSGAHGRRPRANAQQCGMWSEPQRDKCRMHGGRMIEALEERGMVVKGTRSKYTVKLSKRADELRRDPELNTLREEVSYLKAVFQRAVDSVEAGDDDAPRPNEFVGLIEAIRRAVETQVRVEGERRAKLDISELVVIVNQIKLIIEQEVEDFETRKRIARRLSQLVLRPARGRDRQKRDAPVGVG